MSFDFEALDLSAVEADKGAPKKYLDVGDHDVVVKEARMKDTMNGGGKYLECTFADKDGLTILERYNLVNKNDKAVAIWKAQLKAMLEASDHKDPNKPGGVDKIAGLQVKIKVGLGKKKDDGSQWPEVKLYEKSSANVVAMDDDEIPF